MPSFQRQTRLARHPSRDHPYEFRADGQTLTVQYAPGESNSGLFGGNSNWRGPIWFPVNYLLVEALQRYHLFYGNDLKVECPTGSGRMLNLSELSKSAAGLFAFSILFVTLIEADALSGGRHSTHTPQIARFVI